MKIVSNKSISDLIKSKGLTEKILTAPQDANLTLIYPDNPTKNLSNLVISFIKFVGDSKQILVWNEVDEVWQPSVFNTLSGLVESIEQSNGGYEVFSAYVKDLRESLSVEVVCRQKSNKQRYWVVPNNVNENGFNTNSMFFAWLIYLMKFKKNAQVWDTAGWIDQSETRPWLQCGYPPTPAYHISESK